MIESNTEPVIGLEIHVELKTKSKMFCGCAADWFGKKPNSVCCPVCLGLPGALPVPNKRAIEWCVMLGLALNCEIPEFSKFDRKNYFYPDLPKGYQISQYDKPFAINGQLVIPSDPPAGGESRNLSQMRVPLKQIERSLHFGRDDRKKLIRIRRVHMEEDTGKLIHAEIEDPTSPSRLRGASENCTLIDFNRSGVPLVEIVTEPDIRSSDEARVFLKKLHQIIRYLGISDADMEKGSMRLEPNVSVREVKSNEELPKYKVEVKNINSFSFAKKAIDYEISRHIEILKKGEIPVQETRGWDEKKGITYSQRSKEEAHDYRYFPEPDIPPVRWTKNQISKIKDQIGELPDEKIERFMKDYGLSEYDVTILTDEKETADFFEKCNRNLSFRAQPRNLSRMRDINSNKLRDPSTSVGMTGEVNPKIIANWIINKKVDIKKMSPEELIKLIAQQNQKSTISDEELEKVIKRVIEANPKAVSDYKSGKEQAIMFLVGQVMRMLRRKVGANIVKEKLLSAIS